MPLPPLTPEQRAAASGRALAARARRAEVKADLRCGRTSLAEVIVTAHHDEALARMRVSDLLMSVPGVGPARAAALMERVGIAPSRRLRGLGERQAAALLDAVGAR